MGNNLIQFKLYPPLAQSVDKEGAVSIKNTIKKRSLGFQKKTKARKEALLYKTTKTIKAVKNILAEGEDVLKERVKLFKNMHCIFVTCGQILPKYGSDCNIT